MTRDEQPASVAAPGLAAAVDDNTITGVSVLLERLKGSRASGQRWYRGQIDSSWTLSPRVARSRAFMDNERELLKGFQKDAVNRMPAPPTTHWGWLALAQHYGLPTRLLDWSESAFVALYFAVEADASDPDSAVDGAFFELDPGALNEDAYPNAPKICMFDHDDFLRSYLPDAPQGPSQGPIAAVAARAFDRITAQVGTFTVSHSLPQDLEGRPNSALWLRRLRVPAAAKPLIRAELTDMNINPSTVYPNLGHLADHLKGLDA